MEADTANPFAPRTEYGAGSEHFGKLSTGLSQGERRGKRSRGCAALLPVRTSTGSARTGRTDFVKDAEPIKFYVTALGFAPCLGQRALARRDGFARLTNEVQHFAEVLPWEHTTVSLPLKSGVKWPDFMPRGNRTGKSLQLWIARHRRLCGR